VLSPLGAYLLASGSVLTAVSITQRPSGRRSLRGNSVETKPSAPLTGSSPLTMLGSSYVSSIQLSSKRVYRF